VLKNLVHMELRLNMTFRADYVTKTSQVYTDLVENFKEAV